MKRVNMLLNCGVTPIMVFDGGYLPMKQRTEETRRMSRNRNFEQGVALRDSGDHNGANVFFSKAVDVTSEMAKKLIDQLEFNGVRYVVAPYEADSQMAYLSRKGMVDFIISEDSDCIPFGCDKILFKFDASGHGEYVDVSRFPKNKEISLANFTQEMILDMCILSGCDYLASCYGMGIKGAHKLVSKYRKTHRILKGLRFEGSFSVPNNYENDFYKAKLTFLHQMVYPYTNTPLQMSCVVPLTPYPQDKSFLELLHQDDRDLSFLGQVLGPEVSFAIATGIMDPISKKPFPGDKSENTIFDLFDSGLKRSSSFLTVKDPFPNQLKKKSRHFPSSISSKENNSGNPCFRSTEIKLKNSALKSTKNEVGMNDESKEESLIIKEIKIAKQATCFKNKTKLISESKAEVKITMLSKFKIANQTNSFNAFRFTGVPLNSSPLKLVSGNKNK